MKRSEDRLLTPHMGSRPRVDGLADLLLQREAGERVDPAALADKVDRGIDYVVTKQIEAGVDVGNDGELPRPSFVSYVHHRMSGFGGSSERPTPLDARRFPRWAELMGKARERRRMDVYAFPACIGEDVWGDGSDLEAEIASFRRSLERRPDGFVEAFMTSASPGFVATALMNQHYDSHEAYVYALARALKNEYEAIVDAGFLLQIDSPDMGMERAGFFQDKSLSEFQAAMEMHVEALNLALENVPAEKVRFHACWGNRDSPHAHDVPCPDVLPIMYRIKCAGLCLPFANSRHAHEIEAFRTMRLPDHMSLVSGAIETTHNYLEHPQVVAERLLRAVAAVGDRERVIASTDCGFSTLAGDGFVAEDVVWAKLASLKEGAEIASRQLWGRAAA